MHAQQIRSYLFDGEVNFTGAVFKSGFWGTRFIFEKRELKKDAFTTLKPHVKAYFERWCIETYS